MNDKFKYLYNKLDKGDGLPVFEKMLKELNAFDSHYDMFKDEFMSVIDDIFDFGYQKAVFDISQLPEVEIHIKD